MKAALFALALIAAPALAQEAPMPVCARQEMVPGFETWGEGPARAALAVGRSSSLKLRPAGSVAFVPPLARPAMPGTFGGGFPLRIAKAGTYRIALSAPAWIDVIGHGKPLVSTAHAHGPACSGIGKIVAFRLAPGRYTVQLSEAKADGLLAMVSSR